jgi:hypothetical protein
MKAVRQRAVSSINNRVDTLLKHRGASAKRRGGEFEAAMIRLAPMATRIAFGFWSIAQSNAGSEL